MLMANNHRLMSIIAEFKWELSQARAEKDFVCKNIKMLKTGTKSSRENFVQRKGNW